MATLKQLRDGINDARLTGFIGGTAIVGLYQFYKGEPIERSQDFGELTGFKDGVMVLQTQYDRKFFPIQYEALVPAPRGKYRLKTTDGVIVNPDYLVSWRLDLDDNLEDSQWEANTAPHFESIVGKEWDFTYSYDKEYLRRLIISRGKDFISKTIIVALDEYSSKKDGSKKFITKSQIYGEVIRISFSEGVVIKLKDDSEYKLPPDISMVQFAPPGEYELSSTGEIIVNPDLVTRYTKTLPRNSA